MCDWDNSRSFSVTKNNLQNNTLLISVPIASCATSFPVDIYGLVLIKAKNNVNYLIICK